MKNDQLLLVGFTTCDNEECDTGPFPLCHATIVGKGKNVRHYCSDACADHSALEKLRRAGL